MSDPSSQTESDRVLPVIEEQLHVDIRQNVTGLVRLEKTVRQYDELVEQDLLQETLSIEHVPLHQYIDEPVTPRQEGDVTIFPVMEEILIVKKQLVLKEEIRVTRQRTQTRHRQAIPLRAENISVQHLPGATSS